MLFMFPLETSIPSLIGWMVGLQQKIINIFDFKQNIKNKLKKKPQIKFKKKGKNLTFNKINQKDLKTQLI